MFWPFGCEPNGPCSDCRIPTLLRFLCHKNVTRIVEMCALSERLRRGQGSWGVPDARGSNQASATTTDCRSIISLHPATPQRIIKGRPFEVGFERRDPEVYRKEHP